MPDFYRYLRSKIEFFDEGSYFVKIVSNYGFQRSDAELFAVEVLEMLEERILF